MILNQTNIGVFSFPEAMSDSNGKTSGSKFAGFIGITIASLGFIVSMIAMFLKLPESMTLATISAALIGSSSVLFGYSKSKDGVDTTNSFLPEK